MFQAINGWVPYLDSLTAAAAMVAYVLLTVTLIIGVSYVIATPDVATMYKRAGSFVLGMIIILSLYNPALGGGQTAIELFVKGTDWLTISIANYLGGDPKILIDKIWTDYAKQIEESKAFTSSYQANPNVSWWDGIVAGAVDSAIGFTSGIIHTTELFILAVFSGAAGFVLFIRKMTLNLLLPIGFLVIPFWFIPAMRQWVKAWIFVVIETAAVVIPVSIIIKMTMMGIIRIMGDPAGISTMGNFISLFGLIFAGISMTLGAAAWLHGILHGSVGNVASMAAAGAAMVTGKAASQMGNTVSNIDQAGQIAKQGAADYKASKMQGPGYQNPYMNNQGGSGGGGGGTGRTQADLSKVQSGSTRLAYKMGGAMETTKMAAKSTITNGIRNVRRRTGL